MRPIALQPLAQTNFGRRPGAASLLLLLLCLGLPRSAAVCPPCCLCASDIVSCSSRNLSALPFDLPGYATRLDLSHNVFSALSTAWIPRRLARLATLVLSRNSIGQIEANAFNDTPGLLHLDLSSNRITELNMSVFAGLNDLEELLLYDNRIALIHPGAFGELSDLQRLYLSGNRLRVFPAELYQGPGGPRNLTFLDLSNNQLAEVSVQRLLSLTRRGSIYLQGNPLLCDCAFLALLEYWMWKEYRPLVDFRDEYSCGGDSAPGLSCNQQQSLPLPLESPTYREDPGRMLQVPCPGLASSARPDLVVFWVTPKTVVNSSASDPGARLIVLPNGTLEIRGALLEDSGTYGCVAARQRQYLPYESIEVQVAIGNSSAASTSGAAHRSGAEHFNTAFTTLASCVVSIVLVLLYLYLTPCRCRDSRGGARGCGGRAIILCSDPREVESGQRRSNGKRVAFLESQMEDCEVGGSKTPPPLNLGQVATEGILKNGSKAAGQNPADTTHLA